MDIAGSNPAGGTTKSEKPVTNSVAGFFATDMPGFEPDRVRIPASSQGLWAKNSKYEYCYHFSNSNFMPSEDDLDVRRPTAEELQTFID